LRPDVAEHDTAIDAARLRLGAVLGQGAFGVVRRAVFGGTDVAVKTIAATRVGEAAVAEFRREASILSALRHPNIVLFLGTAVLEDGALAVVSEFMVRGSLHDLLHSAEPLDGAALLGIALDAAQGMEYLHLRSPPVVHRDLKSHNLLVGRGLVVKVSDFGLSSLQPAGGVDVMRTLCGTPCWMAPELLREEPYTHKVDVYSFGVVLWELYSRAEPFAGWSLLRVVEAVSRQNLRPEIPVTCPAAMRSLIEHCWHPNPAMRPEFSVIVDFLRRQC
jgi:serine/threonine-protein kinase CTR1